MDMLKCFFEVGNDPVLLGGLKIMQEKALCEGYVGNPPVISSGLKSVDLPQATARQAAGTDIVESRGGGGKQFIDLLRDWFEETTKEIWRGSISFAWYFELGSSYNSEYTP